jgi:hypothetical protein
MKKGKPNDFFSLSLGFLGLLLVFLVYRLVFLIYLLIFRFLKFSQNLKFFIIINLFSVNRTCSRTKLHSIGSSPGRPPSTPVSPDRARRHGLGFRPPPPRHLLAASASTELGRLRLDRSRLPPPRLNPAASASTSPGTASPRLSPGACASR